MNFLKKKNLFVLLLVGCLMMLMVGCGKEKSQTTANNPTTDQTAANQGTDAPVKPTKPAIKEDIEYASVVEISINPFFRVYLDANQNVLEVESLNNDAVDVVKNLEISERNFDDIFKDILEESVSQGFLTDGKKVEVQVVKNSAEVYAPSIVEHAAEIVNDTATAHEINTNVAIAMAKEVVEEQADTWQEDDFVAYVENAPVLDIEKEYETETEKATESEPETENNHAPQDCESCSGTGLIECHVCEGNGSLSCVECNATGNVTRDCDQCENGLVLCDNCKGNYTNLPCDACGGDGLLEGRCPYCKGTGKCTNCGGTGQEKDNDGSMKTCHTCNGNGLHTNIFYGQTKPCYGNAPCNRCPGTGTMICRVCYEIDRDVYSSHPGYVECNACENGVLKGDCPACEGGITNCENCHGEGKITCHDCEGKGKI